MEKIKVYNIVFLQNQDSIDQMINDLGVTCLSDLDDTDVFNYLEQWHQDDLSHYDSNIYSVDDLDTEFLGYRWDDSKENEGYLLSRNDNLNYVGLSYFKTIEVSK